MKYDALQQKVPYDPPTSSWFGINTFSHKRAAVFSSQEVHDIIGCKL